MNRLAKIAVALGLMGLGWNAFSEDQPKVSETPRAPTVLVAEIRGTINPATSSYLKDAIHRAEKMKAQALVVELDTPGGLVQSVREMAQSVDDAVVPVIVYVGPAGASATSAGALLMLSSHVAAMAPGTNIGAAHPVGAQGEEVKGAAGEKAVNDVKAFSRGLAELRGRNVKLAEEVVSKSTSMTSEEALKKKFIDVSASTRAELLNKIDGRKVKLKSGTVELKTAGAQIVQKEMSLGQKLLHYVAHPNIAAILMSLGLLLIYIELNNPGITVAGIGGGLCLILAFMAFQVLPIQVGGVVLLVLGMLLLLLEPFVATGGILAGGGVVAFILGLVWFVDPERTDLRVSTMVLVATGVSLAFGAAVIGYAALNMRKLSEKVLRDLGGSGQKSGLLGYQAVIAEVGVDPHRAIAHIRGETWSVVSKDELTKGQKVEVIDVEGLKATVKAV
jgi:membrane-bound serine protease (ClpP class)